jgi:hypothetical protein
MQAGQGSLTPPPVHPGATTAVRTKLLLARAMRENVEDAVEWHPYLGAVERNI